MTNSHEHENQAVADLKAREAADPRVTLTRRECQVGGGWGQTSQIAKENSGVLHRVVDGTIVRITAASFYRHLIDLAERVAAQGSPAARDASLKSVRASEPPRN